MFCPNCSHENSASSKFCAGCGSPLGVQTPVKNMGNLGMSTLRIVCRPDVPLWWKLFNICMPWRWKYKFYIDVDGNEYTMVSSEKVKEIRLPAGRHNLRIGYMIKNKTSKFIAGAGNIISFAGLATGSSNALLVGGSMAGFDITEYFTADLEAGQTYEFRLKMNNLLVVTEDTQR